MTRLTSQGEPEPLESKAYQRAQEFLTQRLVPLARREAVAVERQMVAPVGAEGPRSMPTFSRLELVREYRAHQKAATPSPAAPPPDLAARAALPAPLASWMSIGPVVVRKGQGATRPAVSGRAIGLAMSPGAGVLYVASANGGVWRSEDRGETWISTMDAWDLNPLTSQSDSLACGAIAIDRTKPLRVFVGTGEGAGGAYFGVGPIRTDDGGSNWITESVSAVSPPLAGAAFYELSIDPNDHDHVLGATSQGLYRRTLSSGTPEWRLVLAGKFTSVCSTGSGAGRVFFACAWSGQPFRSTDGQTWTTAGSGFPTANVARVGLVALDRNGSVVYALVADRTTYHLLGVWRLDPAGAWRPISGVPSQLFGTGPRGQGWYDLAIAVDPNDADRIYVGGSTALAGGQWSGSLFRCDITRSGSGGTPVYTTAPTYIGGGCHADIHSLVFEPGDSDRLWVCCDGGVFSTDDARGAADFLPRNVGLATLTMNHLGTHPDEESVLFCGTQDNGTTRYTGETAWLHSGPGDGGYAIINAADPYRILRTYTYGIIYQATDGGMGYNSWTNVSIPSPFTQQSLFYAPMAAAPYDPTRPATAEVVAFGGGRVWLSSDFGSTWASLPSGAGTDDLPTLVRSLALASDSRLFAGTLGGEVYRFERDAAGWTRTAIHAQPLLQGPVTEIALDPSDATGQSIYIAFGGQGSFEHVWHFDGTSWTPRSGPAAGHQDSLLDVHCDAVVVDPANPAHVYVGADIGIWRSLDSGLSWEAWSHGLPDAAVLDLRIHAKRRVIFAATHGRGVFERVLDTDTANGVELYVRDTQLDLGRRDSVDGLPDPVTHGGAVSLLKSPDIKVDPPSGGGTYQQPLCPGFFDFIERLDDRSAAVPASGSLPTRVHVLVHNRGVAVAINVGVSLLMARDQGALPAFPPGYDALIRSGQPVASPDWSTVGTVVIDAVRHGLPRVASFEIQPAQLGAAGRTYRLWCALHCQADAFASSALNAGTVAIEDRKVAQRELKTM